jgi:putative acetyltransferase
MARRAKRVDIVIRALEPDDAEGFARLQAMPGYRFGTLRPPYPTIASVRQALEKLSEGDLVLGAFLASRLVGVAGLHRRKGRRSHAAELGIGVADDVARRGVGTALMQALIEAADKWLDIRRIEIAVFHDNAEAIRLYERHGFEREGVFRAEAFRDGRYVDVVAMARLRGIPG